MFADNENEFGDLWSSIKNVGKQFERNVIRKVAQPVSHISTQIEKHVIRPTIGSKGIGRPLATAAKQIERGFIRPVLGRAIAPIAKIMPKITIGGHRYDLGGHQVLQKTVTGAVAGTVTGGFPYGTLAGAVASNLQKGQPDVLKGLQAGAIAGAMTNIKFPSSEVAGTGMTQAEMAAAGATPQQIAEIVAASNAPGGIAANAALMPSVGDTVSNIVTQDMTTFIPGTGMTGQQMLDAGATQQQVSEIIQAANAPGGIGNAANAALMPDIGGTVNTIPGAPGLSTGVAKGTIPQAGGGGITAAEVIAGTTAATAVVGAGTQLATVVQGPQRPAEQTQAPVEAGMFPANLFTVNNLPYLIGGLAIIGVTSYIILRKKTV